MKSSLKLNGVDLKIAYEFRRGGADSLVFIHGLGSCKDCFKEVWQFPGYEKYSILTFDLPGFGDSDRPVDFPYSIEEHAEISKALIDQLGLERIHIIGHSMGGAIGLLLIKLIAQSARSFVCLEGNLISEDCMGSRKAVAYSLEDFQDEGYEKLKSDIYEQSKESTIEGDSLRLYHECLSKCDPYAFYKSSASLVKWSDSGEFMNMLNSLTVPKYYVFGQINANSPTVKALLSTPKVEISNAGHAMMNDNPQEFYTRLLEIL